MRFVFSKEEDEDEDEESVKSFPVFRTWCDIFIVFLHAITFLHVLHLDVLRRQIEIETESKKLIFPYVWL